MAGAGVSGVAVACVAAGSVLIWTGLKGGSIVLTLQEIIQGKRPSGTPWHPINLPPEAVAGGKAAAGGANTGAGAGGGKVNPTPFPKLPSSGGGGGGGSIFPKLPKIQPPKVAPPSNLPYIPPTHITAPKPSPPWWHFW